MTTGMACRHGDAKVVMSSGVGRKEGMHNDLASIFHEKIELISRSKTIAS